MKGEEEREENGELKQRNEENCLNPKELSLEQTSQRISNNKL